MTAEAPRAYRLGEFHPFQAAGRRFLHLVPSGGIFEMDETAAQVVDCLTRGVVSHDHVRGELLTRCIPEDDAQETIKEPYQARALLCDESISEPPQAARARFHRTQPIAARVTLTSAVTEVVRIFRHPGQVSTGMDGRKQGDFLRRGDMAAKYDCRTGWARPPLCAGGRRPEAFVRYGDTGHPNLHYCDWIGGWTDRCLRIYGAIAVQGPEFLDYFSERKTQ